MSSSMAHVWLAKVLSCVGAGQGASHTLDPCFFASNASVCYVSLVWLVSLLLLQLQSHDHATVFDALVRMSLATSAEAKSRFGA